MTKKLFCGITATSQFFAHAKISAKTKQYAKKSRDTVPLRFLCFLDESLNIEEYINRI